MCFATDEDDRTAEWVRPCRCRGSTKWVHQTCLQRWVDEKQRGNSTARVACPQCNAEYLIVFPKLGGFTLLPRVRPHHHPERTGSGPWPSVCPPLMDATVAPSPKHTPSQQTCTRCGLPFHGACCCCGVLV